MDQWILPMHLSTIDKAKNEQKRDTFVALPQFFYSQYHYIDLSHHRQNTALLSNDFAPDF